MMNSSRIFGVLCFALIAFCGVLKATAATYYVSPTGNNSANGLSEATALATPQAAINKAVSGDTILIRGGNFPVGVGAMTFDPAKHRGSDTAWLTIKNYPGETPVFKWTRATANYCAVWLTDATHVEVSGLTLFGWNDEITLAEAEADTTGSLLYNSVAFQADGRDKRNSSGVKTLTRNSSNRPHHFRVIGNRLFGNKSLVIWRAVGYLSDGNGIIIDDFRNTQNSVTYRGVYTGRTLVANILAVNNGGSGIHTFLCDNVDIVHNTANG